MTIPDSVTSIGSSAFEGCSSLIYNKYDNGLYLGNADNPYLVFVKAKDTSITSCEINNKTKIILDKAFWECKNLTNLTIPDSIIFIGSCWEYSPFYECDSLIYNEYGNGLYLGNADNPYVVIVQEYDLTIPSMAINNKIKVISVNAFKNYSWLKSITIPNSVTTIGECAFSGCSSLTSITIPDSVTFIGDRAFDDCSSLTSVTIPDSVTFIGDDAFGGCSSLTSVTIPDSVTSIGSSAFGGCSSLTSITIPDSVTSIGDSAFYGLKKSILVQSKKTLIF